MNSRNLRSISRACMLTALLLAGAMTIFTAGSQPANAECKYGGPHCITKAQFGPPGVNTNKLPGTGWQDPDCAQFGNCNSSELKGTEVRHPHPVQPSHNASSGGNHLAKR
jgi:hypothetical protein